MPATVVVGEVLESPQTDHRKAVGDGMVDARGREVRHRDGFQAGAGLDELALADELDSRALREALVPGGVENGAQAVADLGQAARGDQAGSRGALHLPYRPAHRVTLGRPVVLLVSRDAAA